MALTLSLSKENAGLVDDSVQGSVSSVKESVPTSDESVLAGLFAKPLVLPSIYAADPLIFSKIAAAVVAADVVRLFVYVPGLSSSANCM